MKHDKHASLVHYILIFFCLASTRETFGSSSTSWMLVADELFIAYLFLSYGKSRPMYAKHFNIFYPVTTKSPWRFQNVSLRFEEGNISQICPLGALHHFKKKN